MKDAACAASRLLLRSVLMEQTLETNASRLLDGVTKIVKYQETKDRESGRKFNLFRVAGIAHLAVTAASIPHLRRRSRRRCIPEVFSGDDLAGSFGFGAAALCGASNRVPCRAGYFSNCAECAKEKEYAIFSVPVDTKD
jgi:hypothetical protein